MLTGPYTGASGVPKHEKRHILFMAGKLRFMEKGNRIEQTETQVWLQSLVWSHAALRLLGQTQSIQRVAKERAKSHSSHCCP